jgi:hypothetical protein
VSPIFNGPGLKCYLSNRSNSVAMLGEREERRSLRVSMPDGRDGSGRPRQGVLRPITYGTEARNDVHIHDSGPGHWPGLLHG